MCKLGSDCAGSNGKHEKQLAQEKEEKERSVLARMYDLGLV
jgi:hypothetical protein